jgi:hypothetical protein
MASSNKSTVLWLPGYFSADSSGRLLLSVVRITGNQIGCKTHAMWLLCQEIAGTHYRLSHPPQSNIEERKLRGQPENWP